MQRQVDLDKQPGLLTQHKRITPS